MNGSTSKTVGVCLGLGLGIGGALMYWFDPSYGQRRRAHARFKARRIARNVRDVVDATQRNFDKLSRSAACVLKAVTPAKRRVLASG